jgi:hypothetical protein
MVTSSEILEIENRRVMLRLRKYLFCQASGLHVATYRRYLLGETQPKLETVKAMQKLLDVEQAKLRTELGPAQEGAAA